MSLYLISRLIIAAFIFSFPAHVAAQSWSNEQQDVWAVVTESWQDIIAKDVEWTEQWVHPNAMGWIIENPTPRGRDAMQVWDRYEFEGSTTQVSNFAPLAIVIEGNTAIAHYYYSLGTVDTAGERETVHGRCTDVLVSDGENWQFLGWNCGDMEADD